MGQRVKVVRHPAGKNKEFIVYELWTPAESMERIKPDMRHPFNYILTKEGAAEEGVIVIHKDGTACVSEIVANNPVTNQLLDMIALSDEELEKHSGSTLASWYRGMLIFCLLLLWDWRDT